MELYFDGHDKKLEGVSGSEKKIIQEDEVKLICPWLTTANKKETQCFKERCGFAGFCFYHLIALSSLIGNFSALKQVVTKSTEALKKCH